MKKLLLSFLTVFIFAQCKKQQADVVLVNATIYTVDSTFSKAEAFAIRDGKFIAVGSNDEIKKNYNAAQIIDARNQAIYPGFIDGHCHFYRLGLQQQKVNLVGTKSFDEVLEKLVAFQEEKKTSFITGRGWDQNDWKVKEFPTKEKLDALFPNLPVAITRIDGHAMLVNQATMNLAGITSETIIEGGEFVKINGELTGVLIDNAMNYVKEPKPSKKEQIQALKEAEKICFDLGLTTVDDAGLDKSVIELIDSLQKTNDLKMRIYAMISNNEENLNYYLNKGIIKTSKLNVRSVKVYADGALGSRGAALKEAYTDKKGHFGTLVNSYNNLQSLAKRIANSDYQMNTHAIGDSANYVMLRTYDEVLKNKKDRRWRIEHAQIVDLKDFDLFKNILPSVQPTHATSDMYWAEDRVGSERIKGGYAYNDLLNQYGKIALGTDFPIENVSPLYTFYAASIRKDLKGYPQNGYQTNNALSRENTLKGMTIWNAYANFEEKEKGSIEVGKLADFVILENDIMTVEENKIPNTNVIATYINGEKVK